MTGLFDFNDDDIDFENLFDFENRYAESKKATYSSRISDETRTTNEDSSSIEFQPKKKRRRQRPSTVLVPRLLLNDIRRSYAYMYINMLNSGDFPLFFEFLGKYCAVNVRYLHETQCPVSDNGDLKMLALRGLVPIGQLFFNMMHALPDSVHRIPNYCRILTRPDNTCEIIAIIELYATRLYDISFEYIFPSTSLVESKYDLKVMKQDTKECIGTISGAICDKLKLMNVLPDPISTCCTAQLSIQLNSLKQIEKFEITLTTRNEVKPMLIDLDPR